MNPRQIVPYLLVVLLGSLPTLLGQPQDADNDVTLAHHVLGKKLDTVFFVLDCQHIKQGQVVFARGHGQPGGGRIPYGRAKSARLAKRLGRLFPTTKGPLGQPQSGDRRGP